MFSSVHPCKLPPPPFCACYTDYCVKPHGAFRSTKPWPNLVPRSHSVGKIWVRDYHRILVIPFNLPAGSLRWFLIRFILLSFLQFLHYVSPFFRLEFPVCSAIPFLMCLVRTSPISVDFVCMVCSLPHFYVK